MHPGTHFRRNGWSRISEEMAGRGLQRLTVVHQRFDGVGVLRTGEFLALGLASGNNRDRQVFLYEALVHFPHHLCALFRFLISCVDRVALLPEELSGTEERSRRLLPSQHGAPLVPYLRQVAVGLHGLAPHITEQRLGCGADAETLLQRLHTAVGYPCHLRREAFDVVLLFLEQALRDQHREIYIFHACIFKPFVKIRLDILPQGISVWQVVQASFYA